MLSGSLAAASKRKRCKGVKIPRPALAVYSKLVAAAPRPIHPFRWYAPCAAVGNFRRAAKQGSAQAAMHWVAVNVDPKEAAPGLAMGWPCMVNAGRGPDCCMPIVDEHFIFDPRVSGHRQRYG